MLENVFNQIRSSDYCCILEPNLAISGGYKVVGVHESAELQAETSKSNKNYFHA